MKRFLQRCFVLLMVATMASWSQAEICPMKLQTGRVEACGTLSREHSHHATSATPHQHDCCPKGHQHSTARAQCPDHELSGCSSAMACCSLDLPLSNNLKINSLPLPDVAVAVALIYPLPVCTAQVVGSQPCPSESSAFRLKEDLRI